MLKTLLLRYQSFFDSHLEDEHDSKPEIVNQFLSDSTNLTNFLLWSFLSTAEQFSSRSFKQILPITFSLSESDFACLKFRTSFAWLITGICKWLVAVADVFINISYIVFVYICNYVYLYLRISAVNVGFNRSTPCEIFVLKQ